MQNKHPWGRPYWKDLGSIDHSNLDEFQFQDSASVHQSGSKCYNHAEGTVWDIIPGIKDSMYPHQREGFEFIWKNIAGGIELEELKRHIFDRGSGCIISHAPGTGKTRLTIVFLQTYMELNRTCKPVIIAPRSMLLTWEEEFRKWKVGIPFHNMNQLEFSGQENTAAINLLRQKVGCRAQNKNSIRMVKLYSWAKDRSILGISYTLFEKLAGDGVLADGGSEKNRKVKSYAQGEQVRKMLLELPGLLVLDEGHTPRNDQSLIWKALSRVETQRRIILSGTPFQNNFGELFNTLCVVRPKFGDRFLSETRGDSRRKHGTKSSAARGTWASLTSSIGKDCDGRLDELKAMIEPFVHVHKGTILKESLPGLRDSVVVLRPTCLQKALIEVIRGRKSQLELDYLMSLISVHPSLLLSCCLSEKEELSVDKCQLETLKRNPEAGIKTKFLMELIRLSGALKEKVLIFSQYIHPLTLIREQLISHFKWTEGNEVLYMDGTLDSKHRQSCISSLNDPASEVRVLLASTKACSEGINLVGASRVVLLDVVWNPSVERQAISRAYRLGQKKVVYIYHLITSGTIEGEKYLRQAEKDRLFELVFSSADDGVPKPESSCTVGEDMILQEMVQHEKMSNMFEKILNQPKESDLIVTFG
ncbi:chromatin remodeling 31 [Actinidia rufa]|uniref:Chromatin remodeling 31 n=1 Tax=Actinidia rufa TaxID=165716 RepID=A0A7J0GXB3_9ERIC|nr:chromatin remodeling 31 [Actinidia rufa]